MHTLRIKLFLFEKKRNGFIRGLENALKNLTYKHLAQELTERISQNPLNV